ncbi:thermonuclease family protein [Synechococcus sp. RSCCF101]|uniref:thermonuclease family protein n=1 Tax=Synechococcus sp. RSCCF101 TaxID=2511069 RepID=UPI0012475F48|nr:thermonuclease family protein [Synechococcus sp. RSCCF101]QEY31856.1 thermonuclease family protein [Synechococcus sp. RSCCF101]
MPDPSLRPVAMRGDHPTRLRHCPPLILWGLLGATLAMAASGARLVAGERPRQEGTVLAVQDGQELLVRFDNEADSVRLACLQAPRPEQQPHAGDAQRALEELVGAGDSVSLELRGRDVYGRTVAVVRLGQQDLGAQLVAGGMVFAHDGYVGRCDDLGYPALQNEARKAGRGFWRSHPEGIARPWNLIEQQGGNQLP